MPIPSAIDRRLLGETGLALGDDVYVRVVAGMGMSWFSWPSTAWGERKVLQWEPLRFESQLRSLGSAPPVGDLLSYRDKWTQALGDSDDKRVAINEAEFSATMPDLVSVSQILNHPGSGAKSVFAAKDAAHLDLQWRWPLRIAAFQNDLKKLELERLLAAWPSKSLVQVQALSRENARCEILIIAGSVRDALRQVLELPHTARAGYLVLLGPLDIAWNAVRSQVDSLLAETQAGGLSIVSPPVGSSAPEQINAIVQELSHNQPLDFALQAGFRGHTSFHLLDLRLLDAVSLTNVARNLGRRLRRLPSDVSFSVPAQTAQRLPEGWTHAKPPAELGEALETRVGELVFDQESRGATGLSEVAAAERTARSEAARTEVPRFLQGDLAAVSEGARVPETRGLIVGTRYQLDVFIAPQGEGAITANVPIPEPFDWQDKDRYTLQVLFVEPRQWDEPLKGTLELPREGRSSSCTFVFAPVKAGPFAGRVILYYLGRVLQTALLEATVMPEGETSMAAAAAEPLHFAVEAEVRRSLGTLESRRRFDSFLVLNHTPDGNHTATAAGKNGAFVTSLDGLEAQLATINALLTDVAYNQKKHAGGLLRGSNPKLLCDLACEGNALYRSLVIDYIEQSSAAQALKESQYLQIVSARPDAIVPLEFVYEYAPPREGAPVCKNAKQALRDGRCPGTCRPKESPAAHVCPLGFWGLSKVIERHVHDSQLRKDAMIEGDTGEPIRGRDSLLVKGVSLLATSKEVPAASRVQLAKSLQAAWHGDVTTVHKWRDWKATVETKEPVLLVVLPHADGIGANISLEIGGDVMKGIEINDTYVCRDPTRRPIVLLLGCDVSNTASPGAYARHIAIFRQAKAALVLGTVATVLGADSAKVAAKLVTRLSEKASTSAQRFGDVLLQVKREAVADSLMVAMCLVAFGDADWYLKQ